MNSKPAPADLCEPSVNGPAGIGRRILAWASLAGLVGSAIVASNIFSVRDRLLGSAAAKAATPVVGRAVGASAGDTATAPVVGAATAGTAPAPATSLRSQPWWQDVIALDGIGTSTAPLFTISDTAIRWRVTWTCGTGHLLVRAPTRIKAVVDGMCPGGEDGYSSQTGATSLEVTAEGPWHLQVAQEIDAPLVEPPLPAMTTAGASVVATGSFYRVDQTGTGKVTLYHQADGRYSLRLTDFFVSPTVDLELRLGTPQAPHSSDELAAAPSVLVATMDVTAGSLNFAVPGTVDPKGFRSLYVWCALTKSAYAAASLATVR